MSDPLHVIRLRGAWTVTADGPRYRHTRRFGWPAALDPSERVWLVVAGTGPDDAMAVNGTPVGDEADITHVLRPRNEFVLLRSTDAPPGGVSLEVRRVDSAPG